MLCKCKTRQRILKEAFALCADSKSAYFSLSELASRVKISKPAIFRHFKNKEDLLQEMSNTFWQDFSLLFADKEYCFMNEDFKGCTYEEFFEIESKVFDLFVQNKGYFDYYVNLVLKNFDMEISSFEVLLNKKLNLSKTFLEKVSNKMFFKIYFCNVGIIHFVCVRENLVEKKQMSAQEFQIYKKNAISFLWNGLGNTKIQLTESRIKELKKIAQLELNEYFEKKKFFKAFTEVVEEHGINGVTIEKICEKLNIANSSFYSYFSNKDDFITSMITQEVESFMNVIFEKTKFAKNIDELIYILLHVEKNYLDINPSVLTLHGWIIKNNIAKSKIELSHEYSVPKIISQLEESGIKLNIDMDLRLFLGFIIAESGFLKMFFENPKTKHVLYQLNYADELFELIECGIKNNIAV